MSEQSRDMIFPSVDTPARFLADAAEPPGIANDANPQAEVTRDALAADDIVWDVSLQKTWEQTGQDFLLTVAFRSAASRIVLFGESGCGKTQTLRMLAGITKPDSGHFRFCGMPLYDSNIDMDMSPQVRQIAYVFQDYALFPHLTVRQNIAFGLRRAWWNPSRKIRHAGVDYWIEAFGLEAVAGLYPAQLSGGQRQRTALARSLVTDPKALLLDEPFAALDRSMRQRMRDELLALQQRLDIPMILISHDEEDVIRFAEDVVFLENGGVMQSCDVQFGADG